MIDCHCHLAAQEFDQDLNDVIERAKKAGVAAALVVTEHYGEFDKTLDLVTRYPDFLLPCAGVHPVQYDTVDNRSVARSVTFADLENVEKWIDAHHQKLAAIGEVGLDYTPRYILQPDDIKTQEEILCKQIDISKRYGLPLNVHSRSAGKHVIACLIKNGADRVLLHAFSGNFKSAAAGIAAGYYFSVPPSSTRSDQKVSLFDKIPLEQLLLETDSPVLGPEKDVRNEPANIKCSADFLAKLKNTNTETIIQQTTQNALKLFPHLTSILKV